MLIILVLTKKKKRTEGKKGWKMPSKSAIKTTTTKNSEVNCLKIEKFPLF